MSFKPGGRLVALVAFALVVAGLSLGAVRAPAFAATAEAGTSISVNGADAAVRG